MDGVGGGEAEGVGWDAAGVEGELGAVRSTRHAFAQEQKGTSERYPCGTQAKILASASYTSRREGVIAPSKE